MHSMLAHPDDPLGGALKHRHDPTEEAHFDITAMIDLVFMMNIYFLVTFIGAVMEEINLPAAMHCAPLDGEAVTVITVVAGTDAQTVNVFVGDNTKGTALTDPQQQADRIADAIERGVKDNKADVLIKAEKNVRLRELGRVAAAAAREGVTLHMAVMEKDTAE